MTFSTLLNEHASQIMQMTTLLSFAHPNFQIVKLCLKAEAVKLVWW